MAKIKSYKQKDGTTTYWFTMYLGQDPMTGEPVTVTRRGFKTKAEAKSTQAMLKYEFDNGLYLKDTEDTYKSLHEAWRESYKLTVKESTLNKVDQIFRDHILPYFGKLKLDKITPILCQRYYNEITKKYKKGGQYYNYARKCMDFARVPLLHIRENPFDLVVKQKENQEIKQGNQYKFLEVEELTLLLETIKKTEDPIWYVFFRLISYTGLRKGEALALKWDDIEGSEIVINKTYTRGLENRLMVDTAKTPKSMRRILLDPVTQSILRKWKKNQKVISIDGLIFTNPNTSRVYSPSKPNKILDRVIDRHGLKHITVHDLRHTHCCHLFDAKVGIKEVQDRLGHKDIKTTLNVYNHVTEFRRKGSLDKFTKHMGIVNIK